MGARMNREGLSDRIIQEQRENLSIEQSNFLSILANKDRLHILFLLSRQECSVGNLTSELKKTPVAVSRHLTILRENNIINGQRCGQTVRYALTCQRALRMIMALSELPSSMDEGSPDS